MRYVLEKYAMGYLRLYITWSIYVQSRLPGLGTYPIFGLDIRITMIQDILTS